MRILGVAAAAALIAASAGWDARAQMGSEADVLTVEDFQIKNAGDLLEVCDIDGSEPNAVEAIHLCHGIVIGAYGVHEALAADPRFGRVVCPPPGTTRNDGVRTFVSWMKAHPQNAGEPAVDALFRAWEANYPCASK